MARDLSCLDILVVDDEQLQRRIISDNLGASGEGHNVIDVSTIAEAIEQTVYFEFDIAFIDFKLSNKSGVNGLHLIQHLKKDHPEMEVALVSGCIDKALEKESRESGAHTIPKPYHRSELLDVVDSYKKRQEKSGVMQVYQNGFSKYDEFNVPQAGEMRRSASRIITGEMLDKHLTFLKENHDPEVFAKVRFYLNLATQLNLKLTKKGKKIDFYHRFTEIAQQYQTHDQ